MLISVEGLLIYMAEDDTPKATDFLSLLLVNGKIHLRYRLGERAVDVLESRTVIPVGTGNDNKMSSSKIKFVCNFF